MSSAAGANMGLKRLRFNETPDEFRTTKATEIGTVKAVAVARKMVWETGPESPAPGRRAMLLSTSTRASSMRRGKRALEFPRALALSLQNSSTARSRR